MIYTNKSWLARAYWLGRRTVDRLIKEGTIVEVELINKAYKKQKVYVHLVYFLRDVF